MENYIIDPFLLTAALLLLFFDALNAFVRSICVDHTVCIIPPRNMRLLESAVGSIEF